MTNVTSNTENESVAISRSVTNQCMYNGGYIRRYKGELELHVPLFSVVSLHVLYDLLAIIARKYKN